MSNRCKKIIAVLSVIAFVISSTAGYPIRVNAVSSVSGTYNNRTYTINITSTNISGAFLTGVYDMTISERERIGFAWESVIEPNSIQVEIDEKIINSEDKSANHLNIFFKDFADGLTVGEHSLSVTATGSGEEQISFYGKGTITVSGGTEPEQPKYRFESEENLMSKAAAVVASSTAGDYSPEKIRDQSAASDDIAKNLNYRWAAASENEGHNLKDGEWIYVDLGGVYQINEVVSLWNNAPSGGYSIYYANNLAGDTTAIGAVDTKVWKLAQESIMPTVGNTAEDETNNMVSLSEVTARYLMLYMNGTPEQWGVSIYEVAVFGTPSSLTYGNDYTINDKEATQTEAFPKEIGPTDETGNETWYDYTDYVGMGEITADSETEEHPARNAVDKKITTRWKTAADSDNHWITLDLGASRPVCAVDITWEAASAKDYMIEIAGEDKVFETIAVITDRNKNQANRYDHVVFNKAHDGRYIRISCQARVAEQGYSIFELAVYGTQECLDTIKKNEEDVLTVSEEILSVEGFQIQTYMQTTTKAGVNDINFRTVCKAPNKGATFRASDGTEYTVEKYGTIYAIDKANVAGDYENSKLQPYHTLLDDNLSNDPNGVPCYKGVNNYGGSVVAYGYEATPLGVIDGWDESKDCTYYSRTMTGLNQLLGNAIYVRAFIVTKDKKIIYSAKPLMTSVADIASYLYKNNMSKNVEAHDFLYQDILNSPLLQAVSNKFYEESPREYGWNSSLYQPEAKLYTGQSAD